MRWVDSVTNSMDMNWSKLWEIVEDRETWCATIHRVAKSQTWLSNWKTTYQTWIEWWVNEHILRRKVFTRHPCWKALHKSKGISWDMIFQNKALWKQHMSSSTEISVSKGWLKSFGQVLCMRRNAFIFLVFRSLLWTLLCHINTPCLWQRIKVSLFMGSA